MPMRQERPRLPYEKRIKRCGVQCDIFLRNHSKVRTDTPKHIKKKTTKTSQNNQKKQKKTRTIKPIIGDTTTPRGCITLFLYPNDR